MTNPAAQTDDQAQPKSRRRRRLLLVLVALAGLGVLAFELHSLSSEVRVGEVHVLAWVGPPAVPLLMDYYDDASPDVQAAAVQALHGSGPEAVPALQKCLAHPNPTRRRLAAVSLAHIGPPAAAALPALTEAARTDADPQVRQEAILALGKVGAGDGATVEALIGLLDDSEARFRSTTLMALAQMEPRPARAIAAVARRLKDPDPGVRREAAETL